MDKLELKTVLFPTDFADLSDHALAYARSFAECFGAKLHVIHVVDEAFQYWMAMGPSSLPVGPRPEELVSGSQQTMAAYVQEHLADTKLEVETKVLVGRPFMEIIRFAREKKIDLIVMGTHGRGTISHALMGSVAEKVVRKAPCPVLTIRHPEHEFARP